MAQTDTVLEYRQQKIDASVGRFDGNLNGMAENGWTVVSIDRVEDHFLVTYSRPKRNRQPVTDPRVTDPRARTREVEVTTEFKTTQSVNYAEFSDEVRKNFNADWDLKHLVTSTVPMPPVTAVYYTCVWERTSKKVIR